MLAHLDAQSLPLNRMGEAAVGSGFGFARLMSLLASCGRLHAIVLFAYLLAGLVRMLLLMIMTTTML